MPSTLRNRRELKSNTDGSRRSGDELANEDDLNKSNHSLSTHGFDAPGEVPNSFPSVNPASFSRDHSVSMDTDSQLGLANDDVDDDFNFFDDVRVSNVEKINYPGLIKDMHDRFKKKAETWERYAKLYSRWSFTLNFIILVMQMVQMVIAQFIDIFDITTRNARGGTLLTIPRIGLVKGKQHVTPTDQSHCCWTQALQCVLAATSGLVVGLQMKLKLVQKAEKYRRGAKVYGKLRRTTVYYLILLDNGGRVDDVTRLWREAMRQESRRVPTVKTFMVT